MRAINVLSFSDPVMKKYLVDPVVTGLITGKKEETNKRYSCWTASQCVWLLGRELSCIKVANSSHTLI